MREGEGYEEKRRDRVAWSDKINTNKENRERKKEILKEKLRGHRCYDKYNFNQRFNDNDIKNIPRNSNESIQP